MTQPIRFAASIILSGIFGTLANSAVVAYAADISFSALATSSGRNLVAILVATLIPFVLKSMTGTKGLVMATGLAALVPSLLAKLVFGLPFSWVFVLAVNLVYAVAAVSAFLVLERVWTKTTDVEVGHRAGLS